MLPTNVYKFSGNRKLTILIKIDANMVSIKVTNEDVMEDDDLQLAIVEFELEKAIKLRDALNICINNLQLIE